MSRFKELIREVHRRSLWQVLLVYIGGALVGYQAIQALTEGLGLPQWFPALAILLFIVGLPIVLATSFVQEGFSSAGQDPTLLPDSGVGTVADVAGARRLFTWRNAIMGGALAFGLWGVVATGWLVFGGRSDAEGVEAGLVERKSIAVIPFANMSADPENEYFSDGITETIISHLSKISDLKVISRTSVMQYKQTNKNLRVIAQELGVATILEGSVQRAKGRVRITAQLIDAESDDNLWTEQYNRELTDVFAIQRDVAEQIVAALEATLTPAERGRIELRPTQSVQAYDYYLRGMDYLNRSFAKENVRLASQMYEKAIELDTSFALAYARLSAMNSLAFWNEGPPDHLVKAKEALDRAIKLAPDLPETHLALGYYYYWGNGDYERALQQFAVAQQSQPNNSDLLAAIGYVQRRQGKFEQAAANQKKAAELDPRSAVKANQLGVTYLHMGRYPDAERYLARALPLSPEWAHTYRDMATLYLVWQGSKEKARGVLREGSERIGQAELAVYLAKAGPTTGQALLRIFHDEYAEILGQLSLTSFGVDTPYYYLSKAALYARSSQPKLAHAEYDSARAILEQRMQEQTLHGLLGHGLLGTAYAGLTRKDDAVREGKRGVEVLPLTKDAFQGFLPLSRLAQIYVMVGEYDDAMDQVELLLSSTGYISIHSLRLDPLWDPLRSNPRFQALLEKYE